MSDPKPSDKPVEIVKRWRTVYEHTAQARVLRLIEEVSAAEARVKELEQKLNHESYLSDVRKQERDKAEQENSALRSQVERLLKDMKKE